MRSRAFDRGSARRLLLVGMAVVAACSGAPTSQPTTAATSPTTSAPLQPATNPQGTTSITAPATTAPATTTASSPDQTVTTPPPPTTLPQGVTPPPAWLGTRPLPETPGGFGEVQPTPGELVDRRFTTIDLLPPPHGGTFESSIGPVPDHVAARSTWSPSCPVALDELSYVTASFVGFDANPHTGELIVHANVAEQVVEVLQRLFEAGFPIEEMRVIRADELELPPTGDGNTTTAFVCRPAVGSTSWSQHAYGLAIDINPFHNPYHRGDLVLPELASAYLDRSDVRPGMVLADGPVVAAFADIGWGWGGNWSGLVDPMHFSETSR